MHSLIFNICAMVHLWVTVRTGFVSGGETSGEGAAGYVLLQGGGRVAKKVGGVGEPKTNWRGCLAGPQHNTAMSKIITPELSCNCRVKKCFPSFHSEAEGIRENLCNFRHIS